jgi:hypothetical protein
MRLARQPPLMAVCWEQEQPDSKAVTSSTSEVVSEITFNPEVMQIPPGPGEFGYRKLRSEAREILWSRLRKDGATERFGKATKHWLDRTPVTLSPEVHPESEGCGTTRHLCIGSRSFYPKEPHCNVAFAPFDPSHAAALSLVNDLLVARARAVCIAFCVHLKDCAVNRPQRVMDCQFKSNLLAFMQFNAFRG